MKQAVIFGNFKKRYKRSPYDSVVLIYWFTVITCILFNGLVMFRLDCIPFFFFNLELCFKLCLFPRDNSWFWYRRELSLYTARYLVLSHAHHALLPHHSRNRKSCIIVYFVINDYVWLLCCFTPGETGACVTSFRFPFSLIRSIAQWHKHPTFFFRWCDGR